LLRYNAVTNKAEFLAPAGLIADMTRPQLPISVAEAEFEAGANRVQEVRVYKPQTVGVVQDEVVVT
jgi:hypothetical protein